jgi:aminopeptidase N
MEIFNELFGEYPFASEKYGHAQFGWGGGMEHQTMSFMGSFNFELIAHELAHQWFGNYITLASVAGYLAE